MRDQPCEHLEISQSDFLRIWAHFLVQNITIKQTLFVCESSNKYYTKFTKSVSESEWKFWSNEFPACVVSSWRREMIQIAVKSFHCHLTSGPQPFFCKTYKKTSRPVPNMFIWTESYSWWILLQSCSHIIDLSMFRSVWSNLHLYYYHLESYCLLSVLLSIFSNVLSYSTVFPRTPCGTPGWESLHKTNRIFCACVCLGKDQLQDRSYCRFVHLYLQINISKYFHI